MDRAIWQLLKILLSGKQDTYSTNDLKVELEQTYHYTCSVKMIYSHINRLNTFFEEMFGITKMVKAIKSRGYRIEQEVFSDGQLRFIYDILCSDKSISTKDCQDLFDRMMTFASKKQLERLHLDSFHKEEEDQLFIKINTLIKAIDQKKTILFEYVRYDVIKETGRVVQTKSKHGNYPKDLTHSTYSVSPYEIMMQSGHYYLLAYNPIRKEELSIYRIDRMKQVRTAKSEFIDIREMWDMEDLKQKVINMFFSNEVVTFKFYFDPAIFRTVVDQFGQRIEVHPNYGDKYLGIVEDVILTDGLIGWIMMLGNRITVVEPVKLKEQVKDCLAKSLSNYQ